ncbi:MAG: carbohydrate-binding family 9-like protein [Acidobacteriota bacterium]
MRMLIAVLLAAVPLVPQSAIPRYEVKRAASAVTIDGKLDDAAWAQASPPLTLQFLWDSQTGAKQRTLGRVLWDSQALYIGYDADDADITAQFLQRDDPTYRDDAVEVFINPDPKQETVYYGFEMNVRGVLYDYLNYNSRTLFKRFDATGVTVATSIRGTLNVRTDTDSGWSLEVAIPWANFEELSRRPPVAGAVWRANFNRWDGVEPNRRMSIWSDPQNTTSWPHVPARFGELLFME